MLQRRWRLLGPTARRIAWRSLARWLTVHGKAQLSYADCALGFRVKMRCFSPTLIPLCKWVGGLEKLQVTPRPQTLLRLLTSRLAPPGTSLDKYHNKPAAPDMHKLADDLLCMHFAVVACRLPATVNFTTTGVKEFLHWPLASHAPAALVAASGGCQLLPTPASSTSPTRQPSTPALPSATQTCVSTSPTTTLLDTATCATWRRLSLSGRFLKPLQGGIEYLGVGCANLRSSSSSVKWCCQYICLHIASCGSPAPPCFTTQCARLPGMVCSPCMASNFT